MGATLLIALNTQWSNSFLNIEQRVNQKRYVFRCMLYLVYLQTNLSNKLSLHYLVQYTGEK